MQWSGPADENNFSVFIPAVCFSLFSQCIPSLNIFGAASDANPEATPTFRVKDGVPAALPALWHTAKLVLKVKLTIITIIKTVDVSLKTLPRADSSPYLRALWRQRQRGWTVCRKTQSLGVLEGKKKKTWCNLQEKPRTRILFSQRWIQTSVKNLGLMISMQPA